MLRTAFLLRTARPAQRRLVACVARSFASYPPHEVIGLPSLSPTMDTGNMAKWNKQEGDAISAGDIVCEIETDKAVVDYEATDDMFLAKILIPEGTENIPVGQPMMVVCDEEEAIAAFKDFKLEDASGAPALPVLSEEKSLKKEDVSTKAQESVMPQDSLVNLQTVNRTVTTPAVPAAPVAKTARAPEATVPTPSSNAVFEEKWGLGVKKSAISTSVIKKQQAYIALYGITGMTPVELPSIK